MRLLQPELFGSAFFFVKVLLLCFVLHCVGRWFFTCCLQAVVLLGFCIHYENQPVGYVLVYRLTASQSFYVIKAIYRVLYIVGSDLVFGVTFVRLRKISKRRLPDTCSIPPTAALSFYPIKAFYCVPRYVVLGGGFCLLPTGGCVTWALVLLGALVAGKLCNAAKKSCAGLSDTFVYAQSRPIYFHCVKCVYCNRSWFGSAFFCVK